MENTTIYTNKEAAQKAIDYYENAICQLQEELGIWEDTDDCCTNTYLVVRYYNKDGNVKKLYS